MFDVSGCFGSEQKVPKVVPKVTSTPVHYSSQEEVASFRAYFLKRKQYFTVLLLRKKCRKYWKLMPTNAGGYNLFIEKIRMSHIFYPSYTSFLKVFSCRDDKEKVLL